MVKEISIQKEKQLPHGYRFLRKGDAYFTRNCRTEATNAGKNVYVVHDGNTRIGIGIPNNIYVLVQAKARETHDERASQRAAKLQKEHSEAAAVLAEIYPKFPLPISDLLRAWEVGSGRVGRTTKLDMHQKVRKAVQAVARHKFTNYDGLLRQGLAREEARKRVLPQAQQTLDRWAGKKFSVRKNTHSVSNDQKSATLQPDREGVAAKRGRVGQLGKARSQTSLPTRVQHSLKRAAPAKRASAHSAAPSNRSHQNNTQIQIAASRSPNLPQFAPSVLRGLAVLGSLFSPSKDTAEDKTFEHHLKSNITARKQASKAPLGKRVSFSKPLHKTFGPQAAWKGVSKDKAVKKTHPAVRPLQRTAGKGRSKL